MVCRKGEQAIEERKSTGDVKVSLKLSDLKPLHAKWIVEMSGYLKQQKESVVRGFEKAGILEAVKMAQEVMPDVKILLTKSDEQSLFFYYYL